MLTVYCAFQVLELPEKNLKKSSENDSWSRYDRIITAHAQKSKSADQREYETRSKLSTELLREKTLRADTC